MKRNLKKEPQRVASILYKKPVLSNSVAKTKNKSKKVIQKSASQKRKRAKKISKKVRNKKNANVVKKSQAAKKKSAVKKVVAKKPRKSPVKSKGKVDTYKSVDFSSSISPFKVEEEQRIHNFPMLKCQIVLKRLRSLILMVRQI